MLEGKVVVITGGAGLIGKAFVKAVIANNGTAIIADIVDLQSKIHELGFTKEELTSIDVVQMDITNKTSINNAIENILKKHHKIDALVNNAYPRNKNYGKHFFDVEYTDFVENTGLNLGGYFITSQQFARYFKEQGHGNIINISSIYGVIAPKFEVYDNTPMTMPVEYAAIKAGLIHLTKYMSKYFKGLNIRVNTLSPGGILDQQPETFTDAYKNMSLNKGMLDKEDLSGTLVYLLSDMSQYVNGQNIVIDDGFTL